MAPDPIAIVKDGSRPDAPLSRVLGGMSIFTMLICVGWAGLDAAVIIGALIHG